MQTVSSVIYNSQYYMEWEQSSRSRHHLIWSNDHFKWGEKQENKQSKRGRREKQNLVGGGGMGGLGYFTVSEISCFTWLAVRFRLAFLAINRGNSGIKHVNILTCFRLGKQSHSNQLLRCVRLLLECSESENKTEWNQRGSRWMWLSKGLWQWNL